MELALTLFSLGLLGSVHCAGMCGGLVIVAAGNARARRALVTRQLQVLAGKAFTYACLGALAAASARALPHAQMHAARVLLAWLAGATLIGFGAAMLGVHLPWPRRRLPRWTGWVGARWRQVAAAGGSVGGLAAGGLLGLLPCGLSWSALLLVSSASTPAAFLGMLVFGLATAPSLLLVGLGWSGVRPAWRLRLRWAAGPLLIAFGLLTAWRGVVQDGDCPACDQVHSRGSAEAVDGVTSAHAHASPNPAEAETCDPHRL
ncbi:MAG: sulfite exporter TauE/SafE family protein, partial [Planctomycetota bacterium]|nr:sulfite exporter TauE/SafE family protein [Planctomycetota bacterium]